VLKRLKEKVENLGIDVSTSGGAHFEECERELEQEREKESDPECIPLLSLIGIIVRCLHWIHLTNWNGLTRCHYQRQKFSRQNFFQIAQNDFAVVLIGMIQKSFSL
jgi:hypothetical protein